MQTAIISDLIAGIVTTIQAARQVRSSQNLKAVSLCAFQHNCAHIIFSAWPSVLQACWLSPNLFCSACCCLFSPMSLYLKCKYVMSSCRCMTTPYLRHSVKRLLLADGKSLILTYVWGKEGWSSNTTTFNFVYFTPLAFPVFNAFPKNDKKGNKTMERSIIFGSKCSLS